MNFFNYRVEKAPRQNPRHSPCFAFVWVSHLHENTKLNCALDEGCRAPRAKFSENYTPESAAAASGVILMHKNSCTQLKCLKISLSDFRRYRPHSFSVVCELIIREHIFATAKCWQVKKSSTAALKACII